MEKYEIKKFLYNKAPKILNRELTQNQITQLLGYLDLLTKWNRKINLTGHKKRKEIFLYLIVDSFYAASLLKELKIPSPKILDIGAGAGIPSIPLKIVWEKGEFWLVESKFKKTVFMKECTRVLDLKNIWVINSRIENFKNLYDIDFVIARGFKGISDLLDIANKFLEKQGHVLYFSNTSYKENPINHRFFCFKREKKYTSYNKVRYLWLFKKKHFK